MSTIIVEVSDEIAKKFAGQKVVKMDDILDYQDDLKYSFSDDKVSLNEMSNFLWKTISSNKSVAC